MATKMIVFEDGIISLGGEEVPGIMQSLTVDGKVRFDEQKVDGASGKKKTPQGFEDCEITVSLYLTTEDESSCYDKLQKLSAMFGKVDGKANPQIYNVANRHLLARGIRQVVFSSLQTSESDASANCPASIGCASAATCSALAAADETPGAASTCDSGSFKARNAATDSYATRATSVNTFLLSSVTTLWLFIKILTKNFGYLHTPRHSERSEESYRGSA